MLPQYFKFHALNNTGQTLDFAANAANETFTAKGRFSGLMRRIPVMVLLNSDAALIGAARRAWIDNPTGAQARRSPL